MAENSPEAIVMEIQRQKLMVEAETMAQSCRDLVERGKNMGDFHRHIVSNLVTGLFGVTSNKEMYTEWMLSTDPDDADFPNHIKEQKLALEWAKQYVELMENNKPLQKDTQARAEEYEKYSATEAAKIILRENGILFTE